ncbi:MAG: MFS transporter [Pedosphaera sp.]|nr:MFS transporter [Pedosphaera sp.]
MTPKTTDTSTPIVPLPSSSKPTRARNLVIVFAITLSIITYIDRVCISQAAPDIQKDLGLSKVQMGYAFSAFALSYALFEIPGGWLGDWIGPRKVLMRVVVMWSLFTAATGWAWNLFSLCIARFIFGAGEAGCFPNLTKAFTIWLPKAERVRAQGIMWMSARWGGAFTPLLVVWVFSMVSWRYAFMLFGAIGVVWAVFFYRWFQDNPRDHQSVNAAELALIGDASENATGHSKIPWGKLFASRTVWLLWAQYFCMSYGWYFYITWLPTYLKETRGLQLDQNAFMVWLKQLLQTMFTEATTQKLLVAALTGIPLFFGGLGSIFCGLISARIARALGSTAKTRRLMAFIGLSGAAVMLLLSVQIKDPLLAMISMGLASFANDLAMPGAWGACMDVGGKYAGSLSGSMNMMGNLAGFIAPSVTPLILNNTNNNWVITFWVSAIIYFLGGLCWLFIDPVTPLEESEPDSAT